MTLGLCVSAQLPSSAVVHVSLLLLCSCGARLCPPHTKPLLAAWWWRDVVSLFHHSLPSSPFSSSFSSAYLCFLAVWTSLPLPPVDSVSVFMGPGTIRKAQNLLKQYSQHGLDGKKGGSNLTPLEGKAHSLLFAACFLLPSVSVQQSHNSQSQQLLDAVEL